ncbi:MAG: hypothetical protein ACK56F_14510, partial [bacterium]
MLREVREEPGLPARPVGRERAFARVAQVGEVAADDVVQRLAHREGRDAGVRVAVAVGDVLGRVEPIGRGVLPEV